MHFRYLEWHYGRVLVRETDGTIEEDTPAVLVLRPNGASFTIRVSRRDLLHVSLTDK